MWWPRYVKAGIQVVIDVIIVKPQRGDQIHGMHNRHTMTQHPEDQLGIVPNFFVKLVRQSTHYNLVPIIINLLKFSTLSFHSPPWS